MENKKRIFCIVEVHLTFDRRSNYEKMEKSQNVLERNMGKSRFFIISLFQYLLSRLLCPCDVNPSGGA